MNELQSFLDQLAAGDVAATILASLCVAGLLLVLYEIFRGIDMVGRPCQVAVARILSKKYHPFGKNDPVLTIGSMCIVGVPDTATCVTLTVALNGREVSANFSLASGQFVTRVQVSHLAHVQYVVGRFSRRQYVLSITPA